MEQELNVRLSVVETMVKDIKDNTSGIGEMGKSIDKLTLIQENQQKTVEQLTTNVDKLTDCVNQLTISMAEMNHLKELVGTMLEDIHDIKNTIDLDEDKLTDIEKHQSIDADIRKEKIKGQAGFWTAVGVAIISLITSIVSFLI